MIYVMMLCSAALGYCATDGGISTGFFGTVDECRSEARLFNDRLRTLSQAREAHEAMETLSGSPASPALAARLEYRCFERPGWQPVH
ncbi:MAG TPA: hypothetical protein VGI36_10745 [Candidatus Binataceae bacterium]|jgi:hypothetical protein